MTDFTKNANELAHEITETARGPVDTLRAMAAELGISEKEVEAYVRRVQYRKEYNNRPEVKAARAVRQAERLEREKQIRERIKDAGRVKTLEALVNTLVK